MPEGERGKGPRKMGSLVNQLLARRGYAEALAGEQLTEIVHQCVGSKLAPTLIVGRLKRGLLEIYCRDSAAMQEVVFQKRKILRKLQAELPDSNIRDIRLKVQG